MLHDLLLPWEITSPDAPNAGSRRPHPFDLAIGNPDPRGKRERLIVPCMRIGDVQNLAFENLDR